MIYSTILVTKDDCKRFDILFNWFDNIIDYKKKVNSELSG